MSLRLALMALAAALLAACARSQPAPVEFRPVFGEKNVARQQIPSAPQTRTAPAAPVGTMALEPQMPGDAGTIEVSALPKPPAPAVAPATKSEPLPQPATTDAPASRARPGAQLASAGAAGALALPPPPPKQHQRFAWPVSGPVLSGFGPKPGGLRNDGINIAAAEGTPVRAAQAGVVAYVGNELRGFGNLVLLRHDGGWMTAYAHVEHVQVKRGQLVQRGQVLAQVGRSGQVDRPQLHFEIRKGRGAVDPLAHLEPRGQAPDQAVSRAVPPSGRPNPG